MAAVADTNILVYWFDDRSPRKQRIAATLLEDGLENQSLSIPYQALVEFVPAVTRVRQGAPILDREQALQQVESLLLKFPILWPDEALVRMTIHAAAVYQVNWFDAQILAYAERQGSDTLYSEDFQHGRRYGGVRVINPFLTADRPN